MLNLLELEGVKPEPKTRPFVKESKPPDSTIITQLSQLQEVLVEASIDAKETKSGGKLHTSEFWPQWTKPPIFTLFNLRTSSDESNGLSKDRTRLYSVLKESLTSAQARSNFYTDKRRSERWLTTVDWVYLGLQTHIQTSVALERIFYLDLRGVACQFQLIHWSNTSSFKLDFAEASEFATSSHPDRPKSSVADVHSDPIVTSSSRHRCRSRYPATIESSNVLGSNKTPTPSTLEHTGHREKSTLSRLTFKLNFAFGFMDNQSICHLNGVICPLASELQMIWGKFVSLVAMYEKFEVLNFDCEIDLAIELNRISSSGFGVMGPSGTPIGNAQSVSPTLLR
ncbi:hypothetical protein QYF36_017510 [Acer negundo]|nr:hypothetical protein QYF36_017510 [Acer negundo]